MADLGFLPASAPFEISERTQLDRVLGKATDIQRAWLAGFLAGLDAQPHGAPAQLSAPAAAAPLTILFATESGNSESLANRAAKLARKRGFRPKVVDLADLDTASLAKEHNLLVITATWGEGEPPARAIHGYAALMGQDAPSLSGVRFGVLALGDTSYAEFCAVGRLLDARLEALGGTRIIDRVDCDLDYEEPAAAWIDQALDRLKPAMPAPLAAAAGMQSADAAPLEAIAEVVEHVNLNSSRSSKETIHIALGFDNGTPAYEPGDSLELYPENDPALVEQVLAATGLSGNDAVRLARCWPSATSPLCPP